MNITEKIKYVGVNDKTLDLFESQYKIPNGVSYNSYIIQDEKITIMDTVDKRAVKEWLQNIEETLEECTADYLVVSHLEPDHSAGIEIIADKYPEMKIVLSKKASEMLPQFINKDLSERIVIMQEGNILDLGYHKLQFIMAPMVHWPEVMVAYEQTEKILFSADGFGKFGSLDIDEDWACEARRYYFNIVGKYGMQVQALLKKAANLEIKKICPLHGPVLNENIPYYINKYDIWSSYKSEEKGILVAYNSIHGNTEKAVNKLVEILKETTTEKIVTSDLVRTDFSEVIEDAFKYDKMIIASPTYDAGLFPDTEKFLRTLKHKNFQNKKVGIIENGSWAPIAAKCMKEILADMKNIEICDQVVTIKTKMNKENEEQMRILINQLLHID